MCTPKPLHLQHSAPHLTFSLSIPSTQGRWDWTLIFKALDGIYKPNWCADLPRLPTESEGFRFLVNVSPVCACCCVMPVLCKVQE